MALYVYGIMRPGEARRAAEAINREARHRVQVVEGERASALVSPMAAGDLRLRRETVMAHADVLQAAFAHGPVLPLRFGIVVADADSLAREVLEGPFQQPSERLDTLDGKAEMQLKATYCEEPLLRSILAHDSALRRDAQRIQKLPPAATHFERIRLGEAIAAAVEVRQLADRAALLRALAPLAVAHAVGRPHHERAVANLSFLVRRESLARFDRAVEALSRERADEMEFKLIGPLPPYSFADGNVVLGSGAAGASWG